MRAFIFSILILSVFFYFSEQKNQQLQIAAGATPVIFEPQELSLRHQMFKLADNSFETEGLGHYENVASTDRLTIRRLSDSVHQKRYRQRVHTIGEKVYSPAKLGTIFVTSDWDAGFDAVNRSKQQRFGHLRQEFDISNGSVSLHASAMVPDEIIHGPIAFGKKYPVDKPAGSSIVKAPSLQLSSVQIPTSAGGMSKNVTGLMSVPARIGNRGKEDFGKKDFFFKTVPEERSLGSARVLGNTEVKKDHLNAQPAKQKRKPRNTKRNKSKRKKTYRIARSVNRATPPISHSYQRTAPSPIMAELRTNVSTQRQRVRKRKQSATKRRVRVRSRARKRKRIRNKPSVARAKKVKRKIRVSQRRQQVRIRKKKRKKRSVLLRKRKKRKITKVKVARKIRRKARKKKKYYAQRSRKLIFSIDGTLTYGSF